MWMELEASYLPTIDDFYMAKRPEFVRHRVFHLGQSPQEHILAWQAFADEGALHGYGNTGVIPFYDFMNSVTDAVPTLLQASRGVPLNQRTLCNAIAMFRKHLSYFPALHHQRRRDGDASRRGRQTAHCKWPRY